MKTPTSEVVNYEFVLKEIRRKNAVYAMTLVVGSKTFDGIEYPATKKDGYITWLLVKASQEDLESLDCPILEGAAFNLYPHDEGEDFLFFGKATRNGTAPSTIQYEIVGGMHPKVSAPSSPTLPEAVTDEDDWSEDDEEQQEMFEMLYALGPELEDGEACYISDGVYLIRGPDGKLQRHSDGC